MRIRMYGGVRGRKTKVGGNLLLFSSYSIVLMSRGRIVVIAEACPPADTGSGRGPLVASYRAAMTKITMGGSGVSEANGVLRNHCYPPGAI